MDKLEAYLDRVCRGIGGPRALRQHVRRELREHLRDAAAGHVANGLSEEEAIDRALEDFGGPEQVRLDLEEAYGRRLMPVLIDKVLQWKEQTMRAKWFWTSWAYLATASVVAVNSLFLTLATSAALPKLQKLESYGWFTDATEMPLIRWLYAFLLRVDEVRQNAAWVVGAVLVGWGAFEWRVRSENKPLMRIAVLGTAALGLSVAAMFAAAALVLPFELGMPGLARQVIRPLAAEQVTVIDATLPELEQALAKGDWEAAQTHAGRLLQAADSLEGGISALQAGQAKLSPKQMREQMAAAKDALGEALQNIYGKDADRTESAMRQFRAAYRPLRESVDLTRHKR